MHSKPWKIFAFPLENSSFIILKQTLLIRVPDIDCQLTRMPDLELMSTRAFRPGHGPTLPPGRIAAVFRIAAVGLLGCASWVATAPRAARASIVSLDTRGGLPGPQ